jgi:hypothetical protein
MAGHVGKVGPKGAPDLKSSTAVKPANPAAPAGSSTERPKGQDARRKFSAKKPEPEQNLKKKPKQPEEVGKGENIDVTA